MSQLIENLDEVIAALSVLGLYPAKRDNLSATINPGASNDATQGYGVGSLWYNTARDVMWICRVAATGAAQWTYLHPVKALGQQHTQASVTGTTSETALYTLPLPAGAMGPNDTIRVTIRTSHSNNANAKTLRVRLGPSFGTATALNGLPPTINNAATYATTYVISARNSTSAQVGTVGGGTGWAGSSGALSTATVDMTQAQNLYVSLQLGSSADTAALESVFVELVRGV